jgi:HK97 family phage major capsid protein
MVLDAENRVDLQHRERQHEQWEFKEDAHLEAFRQSLRLDSEQRDMVESILSVGGYYVPYDFHDTLISMLKAVDPLFDPNVVTFFETKTGGPLQVPMINDVGVSGSIVAEGMQSIATDVPVGNVTLPIAPTTRSHIVKVSMELIQDSGYPLEQVLFSAFVVRIVRSIGAANVAQLLSSAQLGVTAAGASQNDGGSETGGTSIGSDDLEALIASVDQAYLLSPKCRWLMTAATLRTILQVKDRVGRPVFYRERNGAGEVMLLGYPVAISPSMPAIGLNNTPVAFGDLGRFLVRVVKSATRLRIYRERFMLYGQIGYELWMRSNALLEIATSTSDSPVKYLQNASA